MEFEHILVVNDPHDPENHGIPPLSREEVWFGLLCRAEDPLPFLLGLERCDIVERGEHHLVRDLHFGQQVVRDRVRWQAMEFVVFESQATEHHSGGQLKISLETPAPEVLTLRFHYQTGLGEPDSADPAQAEELQKLAEYIRAAYYNSDVDTLKRIRQLAQQKRPQ